MKKKKTSGTTGRRLQAKDLSPKKRGNNPRGGAIAATINPCMRTTRRGIITPCVRGTGKGIIQPCV